jgi:predicted regulator of Ras-like GTPase activity (Roadblock/LC7/MglB family)
MLLTLFLQKNCPTMFKFLKQLFSKAGFQAAQTHAPVPVAVASARHSPDATGAVEVASLSLRMILEKLPDDLKALINQLPETSVKVVLPVNAIMKQLPSGSVKMSLVSLYRQSPSGTFRKADIEEKRMVEVPLGEIFKSINPGRLKRRNDQRNYDVPDEIAGLFGDSGSSRTVNQPVTAPPPPAPSAVVQPKAQPTQGAQPSARVVSENHSNRHVQSEPAEAAPEPLKFDGELSLALFEVAAGWAEGIRGELSILPGDTKIVLPVSEVSAGLQKGKVLFTWAQLRGYLKPTPPDGINIPEDTQLLLPLKIVAPAFVIATGAKKRSSAKAAVSKELPDFFGPASGQKPAAPPPATTAPATHETLVAPVSPAAPVASQEEVAPTAPLTLISAATPATTQQPVAVVPAATTAAPSREAQNLGELFNDPGKTSWNPNELVKLTCGLPGVIGAIVALEEGLVVAQKLPEGIEGDTFAAFMPQIFSRLDKYTGEMQLGETSEVSLVTSNGPCRFFRKGKVFFATLGKTGTTLPGGLHLIAEELATQNA